MTEDFIDYSLDIEALGLRPGCPLLSIGCVQFDRRTGKLGGEFYVEIDLPSAIKPATIDASTLRFWIEQVVENQDHADLFRAGPEKKSFATALDDFSKWMRNASAGVPVTAGMNAIGGSRAHRPIVWGNGATYDITLVEEAARNAGYGISVPWAFRDIRDMRTLLDVTKFATGEYETMVEHVGTHHNALDDAKFQALRMCEAFARLRSARMTLEDTDDDL